MSTFLTFAIIYTIGTLLYYVAMIAIDTSAKPKTAVTEEIIDADADDDAATSVVENNSGGYIMERIGPVLPGSDQGAPGEEDYRRNVVRDWDQYDDEDGASPDTQAVAEEQEPYHVPGTLGQGLKEPDSDIQPTEQSAPPASADDESEHSSELSVTENGGSVGERDNGVSDGTEEDGFDISSHAYRPEEEEDDDKSQAVPFDESKVFTEHRVPQFGVSEFYFPPASAEVARDTKENNEALESIITKSSCLGPEDLMTIMASSSEALERNGIDYEEI